ncbi:MAG: hypothetical protein ACKESB_02415 [Candidatus Hodgkinia cicadicola]
MACKIGLKTDDWTEKKRCFPNPHVLPPFPPLLTLRSFPLLRLMPPLASLKAEEVKLGCGTRLGKPSLAAVRMLVWWNICAENGTQVMANLVTGDSIRMRRQLSSNCVGRQLLAC